ncbi:hypothetical protein [Ferruginibacter albus]|uniref:hypothetical protein n=1 Tax=Ferruginibacter albus TaxID=2875540 RepID=UPI001CC6C869|nr:hypothetical protein [Ferruginibacter albus]UAY51816.1 hypothetical protein K9M53_14635 [Ferruginibacter albus]
MRKLFYLLLALTVTVSSCSSSKKTTTSAFSSKGFAPAAPKVGDDGLSYETAIVIMEQTETKGISAEYKWIKEHYSDYVVKTQSLNTHNGSPFDILSLEFSDGRKLDLYFNISNFFGKL